MTNSLFFSNALAKDIISKCADNLTIFRGEQ